MALLPLKEEASFLSSANTNSNDEEPGSVYTEKGSLAVGCSEWVSFVTSITPGTEKDEVKRRFRPLFREDPLRAFRRAMMHGNLRSGGGGKADMGTFMACMEVVWELGPRYLVANIGHIMEDVSYKMGLVILKHFSNPDPLHPNNYWGMLAMMEKRKGHRMSYRVKDILEERKRLPFWACDERCTLLENAQGAANEQQLRRKRRFDAHKMVVQEFVESMGMPHMHTFIQAVEPKAHVRDKTFDVYEKRWVPKTPEIAAEYAKFKVIFPERQKEQEEYWKDYEMRWGGCDDYDDEEELDVRVSANAVVGGGIRRKQLTKAQLARKIERNALRRKAFEASLVLQDPEKKCREDFVSYLEMDCEGSVLERLMDDPIVRVRLPDDKEGEDEKEKSFYGIQHDDLFELVEHGHKVATKKARTRTNMNALCGYAIKSELEPDFRKFLAERDRRRAQEARQARKNRIAAERSQDLRRDPDLEDLFDAVADAFAQQLLAGNGNAFKYCPTPGCSADKATGSKEGIAWAVIRRTGFPCASLDPYGRQFKSWVSANRELHGVAETHIGGGRIKQVNLRRLPALHARLFLKKLHRRHNPEGYNAVMNSKSGGGTLNSSHIEPHVLLNDAELRLDEVAEKQFTSMILKTRVPSDTDIMPIVDVSGSMTGTPMEVAIALGMLVAYAQRDEKEAAYSRHFLTFDSTPELYRLPRIFPPPPNGGEAEEEEQEDAAVYTAGTVARFLRGKPWGCSTDMNGAMRTMLALMKQRYPEGTSRRQILMVFTDMQFDAADQGITNFEVMERDFAAARVPMPMVVFWNIRGDLLAGDSLPVKAGKRNVVCLAGYSADLLQDFFSMLESGAFANNTSGAAEEEFIEPAGRDVLSTDELIRLVDTSPMYARYTAPNVF